MAAGRFADAERILQRAAGMNSNDQSTLENTFVCALHLKKSPEVIERLRLQLAGELPVRWA